MNPANEDRYGTLAPARCHACTALAEAQKGYADPKTTRHPGALRFALTLAAPHPDPH